MKKNVTTAFISYQVLLNKQEIYQKLDSLYAQLLMSSEKRANSGDVSRLEVLNIRARKNQSSTFLSTLNTDSKHALKKLKVMLNAPTAFSISKELEQLPEISSVPDSLPVFDLLKLENDYYNSAIKIQKRQMLPDFSVSYYIGTNRYENAKYYQGFEVGVAIPLFYGSHRAKTRVAKINAESQNFRTDNEQALVKSRLDRLMDEKLKCQILLENYESSGKLLYNEIMKTALRSYQLGEINFYNFVTSYETAIQIQFDYFDNILKYNSIAAEIIYFSN